MEPKRTYIHELNRKYVAAKDISIFFKIPASFLISVLCWAIYCTILTLICTTVFEKSSSAELNMKIWFLACTMVMYSSLYFMFSIFDFTHHTTSLIYRQGNGSTFRSLRRFVQQACWSALPIILITLFCNWKILLLSVSPPHRVRPYLKWPWKHAEFMAFMMYGLITFFKELIIK